MKRFIIVCSVFVFIIISPSGANAQDYGACCFVSYCVNLHQDDCELGGGDWYEDSDCPSFECPRGCVEQMPNPENGIFSDLDCDMCGNGLQIVAENFSLSDQILIDRIAFFGNNYPSLIPHFPDCFDIIFRTDTDGLPGAELARINCSVPSRIEIFVGSQYRLYFLDLSDESISIGPGAFFIEIYNYTQNDPDTWYWATGDLDPVMGIEGSAWTTTLPEEPWNYDSNTDLAFILGGDCGSLGNDGDSPVPLSISLIQNYPNPFNAKTQIKFSLPEPQTVNLTIYDLLGRQITILLDEYKQAGIHHVAFDASDLASGIYFYRLQTGDRTETKRMVLLK